MMQKRRTDAEDNEGEAGGSNKDNMNEPVATSTELEHSGNK